MFVKGNFTVSGFLTCYLNLGIFAGKSYHNLLEARLLCYVRLANSSGPVLYIFFKFFLKSKVIPIEAIDLRTEFESIRQEREVGEKVGIEKSGSNWLKAAVARMRNWI